MCPIYVRDTTRRREYDIWKKGLGKSVVATGIAATTIISGGLSHQVKAEEIVKSTTVEPKSTAVTEKPITTADVAEAKEQADAAKANADRQQEQADKDYEIGRASCRERV